MRRPPTNQEPMTWAERGQRSREELERRVAHGATHECDAHMPRRDTARRWLAKNPELRERRAAAIGLQEQVLAEDMIAAADRDAERARGPRRVAAIRRQIAARRAWVELLAKRSRTEETDGKARGVTAAELALLEQACEEMMAGAGTQSGDTSTAPDDTADDADSSPDHSPSCSAQAALGDATASPSTKEGPRAFVESKETRGSSIPRTAGAVRSKKRGGEDDEKKNEEENASPPRVDRYGNRLDPPDSFTPKWFDGDDLRRRHDSTDWAPYDPFEW